MWFYKHWSNMESHIFHHKVFNLLYPTNCWKRNSRQLYKPRALLVVRVFVHELIFLTFIPAFVECSLHHFLSAFSRSWPKQNDGGQKKKKEVNHLHIPFKQTRTWSASLIRSFGVNSLSSPIQTDRSSNLHMKLLINHIYLFLIRTMLISEFNLWSPDRQENHFPSVN